MDIVQNFFIFLLQTNQDMGFTHFSPSHWAYLLLICVLAATFCLAYRAGSARRRRALRLWIAAGNMALSLLRAAVLIGAGEYGIGRLPLHLCGIAVYLSLFHALRPGRLSAQFLLAFCMPGAIAALLFPDWVGHPAWSFLCVCNFTIHGLLAIYVLMQVSGGDIRREPRLLPACLGLMLLMAAPVYVFNRVAGTNFMFLNFPAPDSPLELFAFLGRPGYILGYLPMLALIWAAIYLPRGKPEAQAGNGAV